MDHNPTTLFPGPVRMTTGRGKIVLDWHKNAQSPNDTITVYIQPRQEPSRLSQLTFPANRGHAVLDGLFDGNEYVLKLALTENNGTVHTGPERLVRPGFVPGTVINYIHPEDYTFMPSGRSPASPSLVILLNGDYLASHDIYWGGAEQNLTHIFRSTDRGQSWHFETVLKPCFWGKLFEHSGAVYMLSNSTEYGAILIRKSENFGKNWSQPVELIAGGNRQGGGPHRAPVPVVVHNGRLWTALEHGSWSLGRHDALIASVPDDAGLLDPQNWLVSEKTGHSDNWPGALKAASFLEGNVVYDPFKNRLVNILRYHSTPEWGQAVLLEIDPNHPEAAPQFRKIINFPGGMSKFTIRYDPVSQKFWSLVNPVTKGLPAQRNVLSLTMSPDLERWYPAVDIWNYADKDDYSGREWDMKIGFQYVDWQFDGDDIVFVSRTAFNGAHNFHNANYLTFERITDFRTTRQ